MTADILTKPLQGKLFRKLRKELLNTTTPSVTYAEGCKTEDSANSTVTYSRSKANFNPNFPYPSKPTTTQRGVKKRN